MQKAYICNLACIARFEQPKNLGSKARRKRILSLNGSDNLFSRIIHFDTEWIILIRIVPRVDIPGSKPLCYK